MESFLIGLFSFSVLGAGLLIAVRLVGPFGRRFDDVTTGRESVDQVGDFLFIFFPMFKFLGKIGFFKALEFLHEKTRTMTSRAVRTAKKIKEEYQRSLLDAIRLRVAKHLFNHPSTHEHKATTSFFLKDIAEYKKKISNGHHEAP